MAKGAASTSQILRLDGELWERMAKEAAASERTPRQEIEQRLKQSLGENLEIGAWAGVESRLTPRARALTRLLGLLADELASHSPTGEDHDYLQKGLFRLLDRLNGKDLPGPEHPAATIADYWWLRLNNAHDRTNEQGAPVPMTSEQRALAEIRSDLSTGQTTGSELPRSKE